MVTVPWPVVEPDREEPAPEEAVRVPKVRRKTVAGTLMAAAMIGLQEALEGPKEQPIVVEVGSGQGNDDDVLAVDLDPEDPSMSVAVVRPWLQD